MRVHAILLALSISAPAASAGPQPAPAPAVERPNPLKLSNCRRATVHYADRVSTNRRGAPAPRKLNELPPAVGFMAVYRIINGCEVPMTIVEYRTGRRP